MGREPITVDWEFSGTPIGGAVDSPVDPPVGRGRFRPHPPFPQDLWLGQREALEDHTLLEEAGITAAVNCRTAEKMAAAAAATAVGQ